MKSVLASMGRLAATLLLVSIGFDVVADVNCDPLPSLALHESVGSAPKNDCRSVCVPDCFCCSRGTSEDLGIEIALIGLNVVVEDPAPASQLDGVSASIFHPPLLRA